MFEGIAERGRVGNGNKSKNIPKGNNNTEEITLQLPYRPRHMD